jgi:hypothetical protein
MSVDPTYLERFLRARSFFDLAVALLQYCREKEHELNRHLQGGSRGISQLKFAERQWLQRLEKTTSSSVDQKDREIIRESFDADDGLPACLRARALALVVHDRAGKHFSTDFLSRHKNEEWEARPDEGIAVPYPQRTDMTSAGIPRRDLPTDPERYSDSYDRLPGLRLAPRLKEGCKVVLDTRFAEDLDDLRSPAGAPKQTRYDLRFGAAVLNRESKKGSELDWTEEFDGQIGKFFDVHPVDGAQQLERMRRILAQARKELDVLVFPELCTTREDQSRLIEEFRADPGRIRLLVAGSCHHPNSGGNGDLSDGYRRNEAAVAMRPSNREYVHHKMRKYSYKGTECIYHEDIDCKDSIRICLSHEWFLSVLICKDGLDHHGVVSTLEDFGVNLLLVPALSEKLNPFLTFLGSLVLANHAVIAVANNPMELASGDELRDGHALFMGPIGKLRLPRRVNPDRQPPPLFCYYNPFEFGTAVGVRVC